MHGDEEELLLTLTFYHHLDFFSKSCFYSYFYHLINCLFFITVNLHEKKDGPASC